jgi:hypothetical protein
MAVLQTFSPAYGTGVNATASSTSANVALAGRPSHSLCITNGGTVIAYIRTGDSTVAATAADYPVLGGQQVTLTVNMEHTHIAYIAPSGSPPLQFMRGEGF